MPYTGLLGSRVSSWCCAGLHVFSDGLSESQVISRPPVDVTCPVSWGVRVPPHLGGWQGIGGQRERERERAREGGREWRGRGREGENYIYVYVQKVYSIQDNMYVCKYVCMYACMYIYIYIM